MALKPGTKLGPDEIVGTLGADRERLFLSFDADLVNPFDDPAGDRLDDMVKDPAFEPSLRRLRIVMQR